jgi:S1-C subfamily serine protease
MMPKLLFRLAIALALGAKSWAADGGPEEMADQALSAEGARIAVIERVSPAVVCIFDEGELGGGSGVLVDPAGYGLTNFHVVAEMLETRKGRAGPSDGKMYELQVLGIDPGGDVAMFRLVGKDVFPYAPLGDAHQLHVGESVLAMGNPFVLSDDYTPTVTLGIVSGVNRYQYGEGEEGALLYSDCIQVDASINPGNSGGPLFNLAGEVIGINGRISVSMRGRVNVGLGYAITTNQIRAFMPALSAGLLAEHGTLQAVARDMPDGVVHFVELLEDGPAWKLGARPGDTLVKLDGREIHSANEFASILGTFPANWPVGLQFKNADGELRGGIARTEALKLRKLEDNFEVDAAINLDATERVIRGFQQRLDDRNLLGDAIEVGEGGTVRAGRYRSHSTGESLSLTPEAGDAAGITISPGKVEVQGSASGLPVLEELAWRALAAAVRAANAPGREALAEWRHRGADRLLAVSDDGAIITDEVLESIEVPLGDASVALLQFSAGAFELKRIKAVDKPTGDEAEWSFSQADGRLQAHVHGHGFDYSLKWRESGSFGGGTTSSPQGEALAPDPQTAGLVDFLRERVVKLVGAKIGRAEGYGSGILISTDGLVLTVDSGLLEGSSARAILADGAVRGVEIVRADRNQQIALLKLISPGADVPKYPCFDLAAEVTAVVGERVLAAGNPFKVAAGAEPVSVARGVYCGTTRLDAMRGTQVFPYQGEILVIDAITSTPGFAGGALINARGELLGMIGRAVEARTTHTNINYALPRRVLAEFVALAQSGAAPSESGSKPADAVAVYHGIKFFELGYRTNPVYVERVRRDSPAAKAGVRKDDLIIGANNTQITSLTVLERVLAACKPGDKLELTILRGDAVQRIDVVLASPP